MDRIYKEQLIEKALCDVNSISDAINLILSGKSEDSIMALYNILAICADYQNILSKITVCDKDFEAENISLKAENATLIKENKRLIAEKDKLLDKYIETLKENKQSREKIIENFNENSKKILEKEEKQEEIINNFTKSSKELKETVELFNKNVGTLDKNYSDALKIITDNGAAIATSYLKKIKTNALKEMGTFGSNNPNYKGLSDDDLKNLYLDRKLSIQEIADITNYSYGGIRKRLIALGIAKDGRYKQ